MKLEVENPRRQLAKKITRISVSARRSREIPRSILMFPPSIQTKSNAIKSNDEIIGIIGII
jgi:hypothetical protein